MGTPALPLSDIVDVTVQVSPVTPSVPSFNIGCIIGPTAVIPSSQRVRTYTSLAGMLSDGFLTSSPEFIAAELYFGQAQPAQQLVVGRQDGTSIAAFTLPGGSTGTGYQVGDVLAVVQGGASGGAITVATVGGSGQVTAATLTPGNFGTPQGTGYAVANTLATTGGHGSGAQVNITAVGDTPLQAFTYCRAASPLWYVGGVTSAVTADHEAIAPFVQAITPPTTYFYTTSDANVPTGGAGNVFSFMKAALYNRVLGIYSTTQGGAAPNNIYSWAAAMGVAMGLNTGLDNSAFCLFGKALVGVVAEPLTQSQANTIAGFNQANGNNGNIYVNYGPYVTITQGMMGSGEFFDQVLGVDMLTAGIQFAVADLLFELNKIPQTDAGETQLIHAVNQACQVQVQQGWIAPGVWTGIDIINLETGDALPSGFLAQAYPYSTQLAAARAARQAMPIYLAVILAGAVQSVLIGVAVQL